MRSWSAATVIFACCSIPVLAGCPTEPPPRAREPVVVEDEWSRTAPSSEWLHATASFSGDRRTECAEVLNWIKGEESCKGSLCEHGRDLAGEWVNRCPKYADAAAMAEAKAMRDKLAERAGAKPTACGTDLDAMLHDGCGADTTCEATAQKWATRCAKSEGSPLLVRILERTIERKLPEQGKVTLDTRSCEELGADVMEAGKCKDRFACAEAAPRVESYRSRCEGDSARPTIATAVAELAVLVGGDKPTAPILVQPKSPAVGPGDVPVALADGSGGVLLMCEDRASDLERYLAARKGCQAGRIVVARAFKGDRGVEVRTGSLDFPDEVTFSARYPTILAAKEAEVRDKDEAAALDADLAKVEDLGKAASSAPEAARALARAVNAHAAGLARAEVIRAKLTARDQALAPALVELAKAKIAQTKGRVAPADLDGLLLRAATRAFADVTAEGAAQIGVFSRASRIDTAAILPKGTAAAAEVLKKVKPRKLDKRTVTGAKAAGSVAAIMCGDAEKKLAGAKIALINCAFGVERCDASMIEGLTRNLDEARGRAEAVYHELDLARTGGAASEAADLDKAAAEAGCKAPWW